MARSRRTSGAPVSSSQSAQEARQRRAALAAHVRALDDALAQRPVNVRALRALSIGGFVHDERRRVIWPMLLGVDVAALDRQAAACAAARTAAAAAASTAAEPASSSSSSTLARSKASSASMLLPPAPHDYYSGVIFQHRYFDQIEKDINRSMCHFNETRSFKLKKRAEARGALSRMLHTLFSLHDDLHYIQGFHDIASVFLLVCASPTDPSQPFGARSNARGEELAFLLTERLALLHIRDSLRPTLDTVVEVMSLIFPLLRVADPPVHDFLVRTNVQSFFTLSWILTWFSHNLESVDDVCRVFDFFLSSHPLMPLYATVALIMQLRAGLLDLRPKAVREARERHQARWAEEEERRRGKEDGLARRDGKGASRPAPSPSPSSPLSPPPFDPDSVEVEMSAVHEYFQHLPPVLNLDALFERTAALYRAYPPLDLIERGRLKIPRDSPLLLPSAAAEDLPDKLTNYLEWKRLQRRPRAAVARGDAALAGSIAAGADAAAAAASAAALGAESLDGDGRPVYATAAVAAAASAAATSSWLARALQLTPFYAYPSARSSRAAMLRFAVRVRANQVREAAMVRARAALHRARKGRKLTRPMQHALAAIGVALLALLLLLCWGWLPVPPPLSLWLSSPAAASRDDGSVASLESLSRH